MSNVSKQVAAVRAADAFYVGGNWGLFVESEDDYSKFVEILTSDNEVKVYQASNGLVVLSDVNFIYNSLSQVTQIEIETMNMHQNRVNLETNELKKVLNNIYTGNSRYAQMNNGAINFNLGIYSNNRSHRMFVNGKEYPSVSMTVQEVVKVLLEYVNKSNVYLYTPSGYRDVRTIRTMGDVKEIIKGLEVANNCMGAFLSIKLSR